MTTLEHLKREGRANASLYVTGAVAEERAQTLALLEDAGVAWDEATHIVDLVLENEQLAGYEPHSDERLNRAHAALTTVQKLYTGNYVPVGDGNKPTECTISLAQLTVERQVQIRVKGVDPDRVREYADAMREEDTFPPLVLFWDRETPALWLADGFHRYDAAQSISTLFTFPALIYAGTRADAGEYAATCNARHGLPMSSADKQAAIRRLLQMKPELSDREIARRVGCDHKTVGTVRQVLKPSGEIPQIEQPEIRLVTRGDSTYEYTLPEPADYATIWQIENCLRNHLDIQYGRRGRDEPFQAAERIHALEEMRTDVPEGLILPDRYRKGDLVQAINNVQEQTRHRQQTLKAQEALYESADRDAAQLSADVESEEREQLEPGTPDEGPQPPAADWFTRAVADDVAPEPWQRIERLLVGGDWRGLRVQLALCTPAHLATALRNIDRLNGRTALNTPLMHVAAACLMDAILQPNGEPGPEAEDDVEEETTMACPECGGDLEYFVDATTGERKGQYCSECGTVLEGPAS